MKKNILLTVLLSAGLAAHAQTELPVKAQNPFDKPAVKVIVLKKVDDTALVEPSVLPKKVISKATPKLDDRTLAMSLPAEGVAKLPFPAARARSENLPGIGVMPGDASDMKIKSIRVGSDRNELVYISLGQLNKIATPFESPQIIDSTGATLKAVGQDLFLMPASDKPLTIYISNGGVGQSVGLTLIPKNNLPAQSIVLQLDTPSGAAVSRADADEVVASDYVGRLSGYIKSLALGKTPAGFTRSRLTMAVASSDELLIGVQYKYAGATYDLYSYKVRSISSTPLELKEEAFYTEAVRAIAFFPSAILQRDEETTVYVVADRPVKDRAQ
jgi:conjugal transfer pilus assembly protein TraK